MDAPPTQTSPYPPVRSAATGTGCCCGMGCLTIFAVIAVAVALVFGGLWWMYAKSVDALTSDAPIAVTMEAPSDEQVAAATQKVEQLRTAALTQQVMTMEFTAPELNALIARHPSFSEFRGKARVAIANSELTLDLSVPLRDIPLPRVRSRWFNGSVRLALAYDENDFALGIRSLSANGQDLDMSFFQTMADEINTRFNEGFDNRQRENVQTNEFWENVRSMEVRGDKLIITTKGAEPAAPPATASP
ncbi:MAG: hypothetical protein AVDCRST_MAG42-48 [uncultured Chthoniobacterales bacterium]|uniref:Uncharacterized protein n=1 Tax=uncultured Chthoniobacterales bacterium TaxID=1836801 RepID=A0A6J4H4D3_9BACT|nr:MAG: hypothetical protein AVDCRST_MAG42-48 [uncultured Chthoniobacterales bacterium]